jgi:hypothetical protein
MYMNLAPTNELKRLHTCVAMRQVKINQQLPAAGTHHLSMPSAYVANTNCLYSVINLLHTLTWAFVSLFNDGYYSMPTFPKPHKKV